MFWNRKKNFVRVTLFLVFFISLTASFQNCGVQRPQVEDASYSSTTVSPSSHQNFSSTTQCSSCHEGARPLTKTLSHNFNHSDSNWYAQDCAVCHTKKENWGVSWAEGQFAHSPIPNTCIECHNSTTPTYPIFIGNDNLRPFNHTLGVECTTCHSNTPKFDSLADWRPANAQPNGLVGNKIFPVSITDVSFTGSIMSRANSRTQNFKLEIAHSHDQVTSLACTNCHGNAATTSGSFSGALFHANIAANPTACLECHTNAKPTGAVGSKKLMRHEAVQWNTNSIGVVSRGSTALVGTECSTCHLNASSMPQYGVAPITGSKPFSGASFHFNTAAASLNSCLDCHAHSRPSGSASFSNTTWKNKTNIGAPPFTTFDLATHAPNVDCATCHTAPSTASSSALNWSPGDFNHPSANVNCLVCHTASGVSSTSHTAFASNCISCHLGSTLQFPNPVIADWKTTVTGGSPSGITGERTVLNSVKCTPVLGSIPNCVPTNPNVIPKGYNHTINTNAVSCQNCHGPNPSSYANGKFHTPPAGATNWIAPAATDLNNCNGCHDPTTLPLNVVSIRSLGIVGSHINTSAGPAPFDGVNHNHSLVAGLQCIQCHTAPTSTTASTWNSATKIHAKFSPTAITTCSECHYKRMPATLLTRANQATYPGVSKQQKFTHASTTSIPTLNQQQCSNCHSDEGISWSTAGKVSFHNKVTTTNNCNLCHVAPGGVVTSAVSGISYNHDLIANLGDCATCHSPTVAKVNGRIPTVADWEGGAGAPSSYTIPSHTVGSYTVPGFTGTHTTNPNCVECHGTGNYKVITRFDHKGLPTNQNSCVSCHLGTKADVSAYIASTSPIQLNSSGSSRHHPSSIFNGKNTSCVGCHTVGRGSNTFSNVNGINYPTTASAAYVSVGCGSVSGTTFSCHEDNQRLMTIPAVPSGTGSWNK